MSKRGGRLIMLAGIFALCGCSQDVDRLSRICRKTVEKFDGATAGLRDKLDNGWGAVRGSVSETSLDSRVALRLRWDKDMAGAEVAVSLVGPGAIELTGTVANLTQRRRAVELAQTTIGVESVVDRLRDESVPEEGNRE
jgi:osmotically-inducible protein OsmY